MSSYFSMKYKVRDKIEFSAKKTVLRSYWSKNGERLFVGKTVLVLKGTLTVFSSDMIKLCPTKKKHGFRLRPWSVDL